MNSVKMFCWMKKSKSEHILDRHIVGNHRALQVMLEYNSIPNLFLQGDTYDWYGTLCI